MQRFILAVEGPNLDDIEEVELLGPPLEGTPIETRYGTCVVTRTESHEGDSTPYAGKIFCRML
jgi:hypothetical protein